MNTNDKMLTQRDIVATLKALGVPLEDLGTLREQIAVVKILRILGAPLEDLISWDSGKSRAQREIVKILEDLGANDHW